jgi:glycerophosphoryl diester phosphodiesterase
VGKAHRGSPSRADAESWLKTVRQSGVRGDRIFGNLCEWTAEVDRSMTVIVIAHRACPDRTAENSLEGIRRAAALDADAVEIDVRLTLDGVAVLMHDRTLRRTTGAPQPTASISFEALRWLRLSNGEAVPTFAEALDALPDGMRMAIEVKLPRAIDAILDEVRNQRRQRDVMIWSQHTSPSRVAADREPEIEATLLRDTFTPWGHRALLRDAHRCGARSVSARWEVVTPAFVASARRLGLAVYSWSRSPPAPSPRLLLLDGFVTDWPAEARAVIMAAEFGRHDPRRKP